jgi:hypothetical protein
VAHTCSYPYVSAFGNANAAPTLTRQYSMDGIDFNAGPSVPLSGAGNSSIDAATAARYLRR